MFNVESVRCFLGQICFSQIILFIGMLFILSGITSLISTVAAVINQTFPNRRMTIFSWVPLLNFVIYVFGFFWSGYIIFHPSERMYLGFIASVLVGGVISAKDILQSIIAGVVLLMDKPFQVGDRITFQNDYGEVISIGLRSVKIITLDDNIVTIPNHRFIAETVSSSSGGHVEMMVNIETNVSSSSDLEKVKNILEKIASHSPYVKKNKPILVVARETSSSNGATIVLKTKCILKDDRTEQAFQSDFVIAVNKELKDNHIR